MKRILRVILPMLLIISFLSQSVVSLAAITGLKNGGTYEDAAATNINSATPDGHYGWLISIQEYDNKYFGQGESYADYSECDLTIWDTYLYDYPIEYIEDSPVNAQKYAYIDWGNSNRTPYSTSKALYVANTSGNASSKTVANIYGCTTYEGYASSFESNAQIIENSGNYENIRAVLEARTLKASSLTGLVTDSAIKSFVGLWYNSGDADEKLNKFVFDDSLDYYDKLIRYLDLLLIVNAMCNNAYDDYIDDFCYNHNQDYSPKFVTILIAATISAKDVSATKTCLWTLPVWYAYRAKGTVTADALRHTDGVGGGSIFSTANTTDNWASVQNNYTTNAPDIRKTHTSDDGYALPYWWTKKKAALSVAPTGVDGSTPGNVGYTYISTVGIEIDPIDPEDNKSSSSTSGGSGSGSVDSIQNLIDRIDLEFYISVESDEYMLRATESGDVATVDVTVTVDF